MPDDQYPAHQLGDAYDGPRQPSPHWTQIKAFQPGEQEPEEDWTPYFEAIRAADLFEIDAFHLQKQELAPMKYLPLLGRDGYVVEGWSHIIAGYPRCGKTELLFACLQEWLSQGQRILYFTEESMMLWKQRLAERGVPGEGLRLVFALGAEPQVMLNRMNSGQEHVVILDTIRNLGIIKDENDNTAIATDLRPWVDASRQKKKTLLFCHHSKKGGGEHGKGISGGHALLGTVDLALEVEYDKSPERRIIKPHARVINPPELLYERFEDGTFKPLGDPEAISMDELRSRLRAVADHQWASTNQMIDRLQDPKPSPEQARRALTLEAKAGGLEREPPITVENVAGKRVCWRLLLG